MIRKVAIMNILFVGNSYTYYNDMPSLFEQLAISNQKDVVVYSVTKGGRKLLAYTDATDEFTVNLDTLLSKHTFDVCFIQEQSLLPIIHFDQFIDGLDCVVNKLKNKTKQIILYATWGRKKGSKQLEEHNWTTESMTDLLSDAYQKAAKLYDARVSPVGNHFLYVTQNYPEINLYNEDRTHPSYQGSCLAALTHYHAVFGDFPKNTDALAISSAELSAFKTAICR